MFYFLTSLILLVGTVVTFNVLECEININIKYNDPSNLIHTLMINDIMDYIDNIVTQFKPFLLRTCFDALRLYSICEIKYNKLCQYIVPIITHYINYLNDLLIFKENDKQWSEEDSAFIKRDGINVLKLFDANGGIIKELFLVGKIIINESLNYSYDKLTNREIKPSSIKFMMVELEYENNKYMIELNTSDFNFYIENNILDKTFFAFYMKHILHIEINEETFDYKILLLDNNISMFTLHKEQSIIIGENSYDILTSHNDELLSNHDSSIIENSSEKIDDFVKLE